jgi:outer membrane lipase/esterase
MSKTRVFLAACAACGLSGLTPALAQSYPTVPPSPVEGLLQGETVNPQARELGRLIEDICPVGNLGADLQARCNDLVVGTLQGDIPGATVNDILLQWAPEEVGVQGSTAIDTSNVQARNVGARLAALRRGASGLSVAGLGLRQGDTRLAADQLTGVAAGDSGFARWGFFVNGEIQIGDRDASALESGFDFDTKGVTAGVDYRLSNVAVVGGAFGFARTDADLERNAGNLSADDYSLSLYGSFYPTDQFYVDGIVTRGWNDYEQRRNLNFTLGGVPINQTFTGKPDGSYWSVGLSSGYNMSHGPWTYGPFGRFEWTRAKVDGFTEAASNPGAAGSGLGMQIDRQTFRSITLGLGLQASYAMSTSWGVLLPHASAEYVHEFENKDLTVTGRFIQDPNLQTFRLAMDDGDANYFRFGIGASAVFAHGNSAFIHYQGLAGYRRLTSHGFTAGLRVEF